MRQIDKLPAVETRPKEMKLLFLGLSRTATRSLWAALKQLGYTPYHGSELFFYKRKSYDRAEYDKLLANYDAVTDCPCANFAEELIAAYPDVKVILTTRDPNSWVHSMNSCYYQILNMLSWNPIIYLEPNEWGAFRKLVKMILMHLMGGDWQNRTALRQGYLDHNAHVRTLVPKEKFLEFEVGEGWGPLCRYLGHPEPDVPYPNINAGDWTAKFTQVVYRQILIEKSKKVLPVVVAVLVGIVALIVWRME